MPDGSRAAVSRGRPRNTARREAILDSAERFFTGGAFSNGRLHDIAAAAKIGDTLLYRYFPTKESLADALVARWRARTHAFIVGSTERFGRGPVNWLSLSEFGVSYCQFLRDVSDLCLAWFTMPERFTVSEAALSIDREELWALTSSVFERASGMRLESDRARDLARCYLDVLLAYVLRGQRGGMLDDGALEREAVKTSALFHAFADA